MNQRNTKASVTLAFFIVLLASFAAMNALTAGSLKQACVQEAVLAFTALAAVGFAVPDAFKRCTATVQQRNLIRFVVAALFLVGFVGGVISLVTWNNDRAGAIGDLVFSQLPSASEIVQNLLFLLSVCLFTGLYEEAFMRVLGIEAFEGAMGEGGAASGHVVDGHIGNSADAGRGSVKPSIALDTAAKRAILAAAALFALLHVGVPDVSAGQLVLTQTALKFTQALLFGVILGVLYAQTRRLWPCALIHAGFDVLYLGPNVLLAGTMPETYASGAASDTILLAVTVLMLACVVLKMRKEISR